MIPASTNIFTQEMHGFWSVKKFPYTTHTTERQTFFEKCDLESFFIIVLFLIKRKFRLRLSPIRMKNSVRGCMHFLFQISLVLCLHIVWSYIFYCVKTAIKDFIFFYAEKFQLLGVMPKDVLHILWYQKWGRDYLIFETSLQSVE